MSTAKDKLIRARVQLQKENPFFSYVSMYLTLIEKNDIPTMGVDRHANCYYNDGFVDKLSQEEVKGVLCHEIMHVILDHLKRLGGREPQLSNIAQDLVVNDMLVENRFDLPREGLIPDNHSYTINNKPIKDLNKKVWEEVYEEIEKIAEKIKVSVQSMDDHMRGQEGEGQDSQGQNQDGKGQQIKIKGQASDGQGKNQKEEEAEGNQGSKPKDQDWKQIVSEAYAYAKMQGKCPAGMDRYIEELNYPKIPWRQLLQKFIIQEIPYDFTYTRPSKKSISCGIFLPAMTRENLEIVVAVDTSGSMGDKDLQDALSEVIGIVSAYDCVNLTVLSCDAEVHTAHQVTSVTDVKSIKMQGGGGTDFRPVFKWLEENKSNTKLLVFFTDGYGDFPKETYIKTLWVVTKGGIADDDFPFGDTVRIEREDKDED